MQTESIVLSDYYLFNKEHNDYQNKYFWPHLDFGYTGVIYLDYYDGPGTNLYTEPEVVVKDNKLINLTDFNITKLLPNQYQEKLLMIFYNGNKYDSDFMKLKALFE